MARSGLSWWVGSVPPDWRAARRSRWRRLPSVVLVFFLAASTHAYERNLDARALREAFMLGQRNDQATAAFLAPYIRQLTTDAAGSCVAQIEILTPFVQVVDASRQKAPQGYTEEQAAEEYRQRGDTVVLSVTLIAPSVCAPPKNAAAEPLLPPQRNANQSPPRQASQEKGKVFRPEDFWQNFQFHLKQGGKEVASRAMSNKPVYSTPTKDAPAELDGANVWIEYDAKDVASLDTVVEVVTPTGKTLSASFDLKKLR